MNRLLIVDDEDDVRYMMAAALNGTYELQMARDGKVALQLMQEKLPDAVVVDLHLPNGISGMDVLASAHQRDPLLPVVIMTASGTLDTAVEALRLGAYDYIMKPFEDLDVVRRSLARALETRRLRVENRGLLEDLRSSNALKSHLLRAVSHDFKNLLTVLVGYTRLAQMSPDQVPESLERIMTSSRLMTLMAEDLGTYSQLDAGALQLDCALISLHACMEEASTAVLVNPELHSIRLPEERAMVWADKYRTTQILTNLLGNAIKYTPHGGEIVVNTKLEPEQVIVSVADCGLGIPQSDLASLFLPFFRLDRDSRSGTPGTGLGLTIVKNLVELHGGRIWAESQEGVGTTFYFTLPRREAGR